MSARTRIASGLVLLAAVGALAACGDDGTDSGPDSGPAGAARPIAVDTDLGDCGAAWSAPDGGRVSFALTNHFRAGMDAYLTDAVSGGYLLEFEGVGPGATLTQGAVLGNGSYRFLCFPDDSDQTYGPTAEVTGADDVQGATPAILPLGNADLIPATKSYEAWVASRLPVLHRQVRRIAADLRQGATDAARTDWLTAHLTYETLGAAYDAFGDAGDAINGTPEPGVDPATDKDLEGFHRLEALLWSGASAARVEPVADRLVDAVAELQRTFPTLQIDPNDMGLRAHEIVENAVEFELNGTTDAGSRSNLANIAANLQGSQRALAPLHDLLATRYPQLAETEAALASSRRLVESFRHGGRWTAIEDLSTTQRNAVNSALQRTVELLAPVAAICDVRLVSRS